MNRSYRNGRYESTNADSGCQRRHAPSPHPRASWSSCYFKFSFFLYLHFAFPFRRPLESQTDKTTPPSQTRVHNDLLMTNRGPMEDAVLTIGTQSRREPSRASRLSWLGCPGMTCDGRERRPPLSLPSMMSSTLCCACRGVGPPAAPMSSSSRGGKLFTHPSSVRSARTCSFNCEFMSREECWIDCGRADRVFSP